MKVWKLDADLNEFESFYHSAYINPIKEKFDYSTISITVPFNNNDNFINCMFSSK